MVPVENTLHISWKGETMAIIPTPGRPVQLTLSSTGDMVGCSVKSVLPHASPELRLAVLGKLIARHKKAFHPLNFKMLERVLGELPKGTAYLPRKEWRRGVTLTPLILSVVPGKALVALQLPLLETSPLGIEKVGARILELLRVRGFKATQVGLETSVPLLSMVINEGTTEEPPTLERFVLPHEMAEIERTLTERCRPFRVRHQAIA